jgi:hypothetical protein|tara:strand:+ start:974 stop:1246 length:273 start_codon:yes stop_codon:yes gene_type:complete
MSKPKYPEEFEDWAKEFMQDDVHLASDLVLLLEKAFSLGCLMRQILLESKLVRPSFKEAIETIAVLYDPDNIEHAKALDEVEMRVLKGMG